MWSPLMGPLPAPIPGGRAYQSLKLQFRNSSSSPSEAACCPWGLEGILEGKVRPLQSQVQPAPCQGMWGNRGWIWTNQ